MKTFFHPLLMLAGCFALVAAAAESSVSRPMKAEIVWGGGRVADEGRPGNVRVTLANGQRELWTRKGNCLLPQVSKSGLVGWTRGTELHSRGMLMNDTLVVARTGGVVARMEACHAFIELWDFTDNDSCIVVLSRNAHGPGQLEKFRVRDGELLDSCFEAHVEERPPWATQFLQKAYEEGRYVQ